MGQTRVRFTCNKYLLVSEDMRCEILDGSRYVVATPGTRHQRISRNLLVALCRHVKKNALGEILSAPYDVIFPEGNVLQPDILFVRKERTGVIGEMNLRAAPDLVVEILSADSRRRDMEVKKKIYARYLVPEYWVVDSEAATVELLLWSELGYITAGAYGEEDRFSSPLLPGLGLALHEVFAVRRKDVDRH